MRCPHCGNDVVSTQYTCHVCSTVLIIEGLEKRVGFLARHEERWRKPMKFWARVKWMLVRPSYAMWDIVHKPSDAGGSFAFFSNILLYGLIGVILFNKVGAPALYPPWSPWLFLHGLGMYATFVAIGLINFIILWGFIVLAQTIAAKFALSILPRWGEQARVIYWTFVPALFCTGVQVAILAIGLPQEGTGATDLAGVIAAASHLFFTPYIRPAWIVADIVQIAFYFGYLSILLAIAYREYYDKSTTRALLAAVIAGVIGAVVFVLTRSTLS
jgi:hypothetical protein